MQGKMNVRRDFRLYGCFFCALTLADLDSCKSFVFLSFRTGPERTLGPGPLWTYPAPRQGRSASPAFGFHLYPLRSNLPSDSESLFNEG